jgi:hypothetical protein
VGDTTLTVTAPVEKKALTAEEHKKLERLLPKVQGGNAKALDELRPILDKTVLWEYIGDLGRRVQESWLEAMAGQNKLVREAFEKRATEMHRELLSDGDSQLERLLVDRVIATWIQVCYADSAYANALKGDGHTLQLGTYLQERQDRAHTRHLKAIKALASVRRLLVPAVQVNIGKNQIISQGAAPEAKPTDDI